MKTNLSSRILLRTTPMMVLCCLLASSASAIAQSDDGTGRGQPFHCSNRTLHGDYGFTLIGEILGPGLQFRGVVMQHYDGKGSFLQVDHIVLNGMPPAQEWTPGTGTYAVNPDCTGSAVITVPGNPLSPINLHFVVVKHGTEIHQVVDANAVTAIGIKVE
jgi:hypothetical protein